MEHFKDMVVEVTNLKKSFDDFSGIEVPVLNGISFGVRKGEIVGIFGPSGCGKSTLLRLICGILQVNEGSIRITNHSDSHRRGLVAYVPQRGQLLGWRTLWDNALLGWSITQDRQPDAEVLHRARELFHRFSLTASAHQYPYQCSGGEQQRAAITRALLTPLPILALDEPVSAIDHLTRTQIYDTLFSLIHDDSFRDTPLTVLLVSHDPEELILLCDRIIVLSSRPTVIVDTISIPFQHPRDLSLRFSPELVDLKRALWGLLQ